MIFFEPNHFHATRSNGKIAPNVFIVSLEYRSPKMNFFKHKPMFRLADREKAMLGLLMNEGDRTFGPDPSNRPTKRLVRKSNAPFAGEQMFVMYLEMLLIQLIRGGTEPESRRSCLPRYWKIRRQVWSTRLPVTWKTISAKIFRWSSFATSLQSVRRVSASYSRKRPGQA